MDHIIRAVCIEDSLHIDQPVSTFEQTVNTRIFAISEVLNIPVYLVQEAQVVYG